MEQKAKKIPLRQCRGCQEHFPKNTLIRVLRSPTGEISLDFTGRKNGRGAYICRSVACLRTAKKANRLGRELGVEIPEEIYLALERELENDHGEA